MKHKITLISLMLLISAFAFGQNAVKKYEKMAKTSIEKYLKAFHSDDMKPKQTQIFKNNKLSSESILLKSTQKTKQKLDSLLGYNWNEITSQWIAAYKDEFTYDTNGNTSQFIDYEWDTGASQWIAFIKQEFTYNANDDMTQFLFYFWDKNNSQWDASTKDEYKYDVNGNITENSGYKWDANNNQWVGKEKIRFTYDANDNMTQKLNYFWDEDSSKWYVLLKEENIYDFNGKLTQKLIYFYDDESNELDKSSKEEYTYNSNGNITQQFHYKWHKSANQWSTTGKDEYMYDNNQNMTQHLVFVGDTTKWYPHTKEEYTYDDNGNMTQYFDYDWDENTSKWIAMSHDEYTYDDSGNQTSHIFYDSNGSIVNQLLPIYKREYTCDNNYSFDDMIYPIFSRIESFNSYRHKVDNMTYYDWNEANSQWSNKNYIALFYSEQNMTLVSEIDNTEIKIYPNPFSEYLIFSLTCNISSATFELYNIQGSKLISKDVSNNEQVCLKGLNNGIYLYKLYVDQNRQSGKLIKE